MTNTVAKDLLALLKDEEAALVQGDFARFGDFIAAKDACRETLDQALTDPGLLQQISDSLARNAMLLNAAMAGVADARKLIKGLLEQDRMVTYDKDGQRQTIRDKSAQLERKA